jgi:hypothetical protein
MKPTLTEARARIARLPADQREGAEERVSICTADNIPEYDALMTALAEVAAEDARRNQ